ncbi:MAG: SURF1 family protein [Pseudomonadota bacterium]
MRLWFLLIVGLVGTGILVWLGTWQVQRLAWKQDLLARIDAQIGADPVPLGDAVTPKLQRYAPVTLNGRFGQGNVRMLASRKSIGPVHRIIRPFDAEGFGRVLVDTGWLPDGAEVPAAPSASLTLIGNLDAPQEADGFTPAPDRAANLWFARDVPAMAETLDTQPILVVLRDAPEMNLGVTPWPVDTAGIPNDHLQYAITWFSLALIWGAMTGLFLLRTRRGAR